MKNSLLQTYSCLRCGADLESGDLFCGECGASLDHSNPAFGKQTSDILESGANPETAKFRDNGGGRPAKFSSKRQYSDSKGAEKAGFRIGIMDGVRLIMALVGAAAAFAPMLYVGPWLMTAARNEATGYLANMVFGAFFLAFALLVFMMIMAPTLNKLPDVPSSHKQNNGGREIKAPQSLLVRIFRGIFALVAALVILFLGLTITGMVVESANQPPATYIAGVTLLTVTLKATKEVFLLVRG